MPEFQIRVLLHHWAASNQGKGLEMFSKHITETKNYHVNDNKTARLGLNCSLTSNSVYISLVMQ